MTAAQLLKTVTEDDWIPVHSIRNGKNDLVSIGELDGELAICAFNEGGYNLTKVNLPDVIEWVDKNCPELLPR